MQRSNMILAQPLYLRRDGGNVQGIPRPLPLVSQSSGIFSAEPPRNAEAQIRDEKCQDDQPKYEGIEHGVIEIYH